MNSKIIPKYFSIAGSTDKRFLYEQFMLYQKDISSFISKIDLNNEEEKKQAYQEIKDGLDFFKKTVSPTISLNENIIFFILDNFVEDLQKKPEDNEFFSIHKYINNYISQKMHIGHLIYKANPEEEKIFLYTKCTVNFAIADFLDKYSNIKYLNKPILDKVFVSLIQKLSEQDFLDLFTKQIQKTNFKKITNADFLLYQTLINSYCTVFNKEDKRLEFYLKISDKIIEQNNVANIIKIHNVLKDIEHIDFFQTILNQLLKNNKIKENLFSPTLQNYKLIKPLIEKYNDKELKTLYQDSLKKYLDKYLLKNMNKTESKTVGKSEIFMSNVSLILLFVDTLQIVDDKKSLIEFLTKDKFIVKNMFFEKEIDFSDFLDLLIINNKYPHPNFFKKEYMQHIEPKHQSKMMVLFLNYIFETNNFGEKSIVNFFEAIDKKVFLDFVQSQPFKKYLNNCEKQQGSAYYYIDKYVQMFKEKNSIDIEIAENIKENQLNKNKKYKI